MAALHPSNPYYNQLSQQRLDQQSQRSLSPKRSQSESQAVPAPPNHTRRTSNSYVPRTHSIGSPYSGAGHFTHQIDLSPPKDEEIIIATVRLTNTFRRASLGHSDNTDLPSRPPRRNFLHRISTRLEGKRDTNQYTAIKMPRKDYKRYFARDREGRYVGTEWPEREWTREDLEREFGCFQHLPLRSVPGGQEYGEGEGYSKGEEGLLRDGGGSEMEVCEQRVVNGEVQGVRRVDGMYLL